MARAWHRRPILLLLCGVLACAGDHAGDHVRDDAPPSAATAPPSADLAIDLRACDDVLDWWGCVREHEAALLARAPDVERRGDTLVIAIAGAAPVRLDDTLDEYDVGHHYVYAGVSAALDAHLVHILYYEGRGFLLVTRASGRTLDIDAPPVVSPDGVRFATASWDTEAGYGPNRLRITRIVDESLVVEFELEPESWGPDEPEWVDAATLLVTRRPAVWHPDPARLAGPLVVRRAGEGWLAEAVSPTPIAEP